MAFPQHWLLSWGGTLYGGQDIWVNGIRMAVPVGGNPGTVNETDLLVDFATDIAAHVQSPDSAYSNRTQLEWVKFNEIDSLGRYVDEGTTHVHEYPTPISGTQSSSYPAQVSLVISMRTPQARGYASKGRLYVPVPKAFSIGGLGYIDVFNMQPVADAWSTFITNLNNMPGIDEANIVASVVSKVPATGATNPITNIRVGNVLDTQTRRRNQIPETYADAAVA